jgi:predicted Zn-dependent protease
MWDEAHRWVASLQERSPSDPWLKRARAFVHALSGRHEEELNVLATIPAKTDPTVRFRRNELEVYRLAPEAWTDLESGPFARALPALRSTYKDHPDSGALAWALAWALAETGSPTRAEELLPATESEDTLLDSQRQIVLARVDILRGNHRAALARLDRAASATSGVYSPYLARVWLYQGQAARGLGSDPQARALFSKALEYGYGRYWEKEALEGGGQATMVRN